VRSLGWAGRPPAAPARRARGRRTPMQVMVSRRDPQGQAIKAPCTLYVGGARKSTTRRQSQTAPLDLESPLPEIGRESWSQGLFTPATLGDAALEKVPSTEKLPPPRRMLAGSTMG